MRWSRAVPAAITVLVLVAAAALYPQFIPVTHVERGRLSRLILAVPPVGLVANATDSVPVANASSPFSGVQAAGKRSPNATGSYTAAWTSAKVTSDGDEMLVSLLPTQADVPAVETQATSMYLTAKSAATGYKLNGTFAVPGVPGVRTAEFTSTIAGDLPLAFVVFPVKRAVVVLYAQWTTAAAATTAASTVALDEYRHLGTVLPGFTLVRTTHPLVATIVYAVGGVVAAVSAGALVLAVGWWRRRRRRKEEARLEAIRLARDRDRRKRAARHAD